VDISVIIRTFNEARYLDELLEAISSQDVGRRSVEVIVVDSGSTDNTVQIAKSWSCTILHIDKKEFTFGRSLNRGCEVAKGKYLVIVSGHCVPVDGFWLRNLCDPLEKEIAHYVYGRQVGRDTTLFSECRVFEKYYGEEDRVPQVGFFCNNANSALLSTAWRKYRFDEYLTGLEDMHLAKALTDDGYLVAYSASAAVYHIHNEAWSRIKIRYEREAYAMKDIMPEIHLSLLDVVKYFSHSVVNDSRYHIRHIGLKVPIWSILMYRGCQYWGTYVGNHEHRKMSAMKKNNFYYPD